ncbi:MAG: hypothetical protein RLZZ58_1293 [Pseudomonadota bacterium]
MKQDIVWRRLAIELLLIASIGLVLGLFGPFGTWAFPPAMRIAYWLVFAVVGYAIFRPLIVIRRWLADALSLSQIVGIALALVVAALPMTLIIATLMNGLDVRAALRDPELGQRYFQVWLIGFLINGIFMALFRAPAVGDTSTRPSAPGTLDAPPSPLADRLPIGFGEILALEAEDHYVRVHGALRSTLVLIRMADAVAAQGHADGLRVHRSWWVARAAVRGVSREGRAATLTLITGQSVAVARDALPQLRAAGWLAT